MARDAGTLTAEWIIKGFRRVSRSRLAGAACAIESSGSSFEGRLTAAASG